jgi:diacylglycerol kinase family enzyme
MAAIFGHPRTTRQIELLDAVSVECRPVNGSSARVYAEADGESLGGLPIRIEIAPQTVTLLIPLDARP